MRKRYAVWNEPGEQIQKKVWREKLKESAGNITVAGRALGFSKSYAMRLTKLHGLNEYASELRTKSTGRARGRPPGVSV